MKGVSVLTCSFLVFILFLPGCSKKEQETPPPQATIVLKFPIIKPPPIRITIEPSSEGPRTILPKPDLKKSKEPAKKTPSAVPKVEAVAKAKVSSLPASTWGKGYYLVKKGENLLSIAAHHQVYGDALKWTAILHSNFDQLVYMPPGKGFAENELPKGIKLRVLTPEEKKGNEEKRRQHPWVVNVASLNASKPLDPIAYKLIQKGYCVYISRANVNGIEWFRLRVGFFPDQTSARAAIADITAIVNLKDMWIAKITPTEFNAYAGLFRVS